MPGGIWDAEGIRAPLEEDPPIGGGGGGWPGGGIPGPGPGGPNISQAGGFASRFNLDSPSPWAGGMNRRRKPFRQPFQSPYQTAQTRPAWEQTMGGAPSPAPQAGGQPSQPGGDYFDTVMGYFGSGNADNLAGEALMNLILGGKGKGMWGPEGDPRVSQAYDEDASRRGLAMEQSAVLGADLDGGDFWNRGLARTLARSNASRMRGDFFNENRLNNAKRYQALLDSLLAGKLGGQFTMDDDFRRDRWAADREGASRGGGLGGMIGGIAGAGLGALVGQPGLGAGIGGMLGGGGGSDFPRYNYMGSGRTY